MEDNVPKENPPADFNKLDLSQLQGFSFGTQWTQDKSAASDKRDSDGARPRREDRRFGAGDGGPDRRDRRVFRRPGGPDAGGQGGGAAPARREQFDDRRQRSPDSAGGRPGGAYDRGPYDSPHFAVTFYPEDNSFNALVKTIRASCRTIELFEIAHTVLAKPDRFTVYVAPRSETSAWASAEAPAGGAKVDNAPRAPKEDNTSDRSVFLSVPDGLPFETEEAAIAHVLGGHLALFFDRAEVEVDPPKGNFQVISRCGVTGELLAPPNHHRYSQIIQQHYAAKVAKMSFEAFRSRIETVRDPEVVQQWLEKMKKVTRYQWRDGSVKTAEAAPAPKPAAEAIAEPAAGTNDGAAVNNPETATPPAEAAKTTPEVPAAALKETLAFDSFEDARSHLLTHARDKVVRRVSHARLHGREVDSLPPGEIRRAIEGALERQRRFPLDTANALRGRLRREHFTIFKKGAKGVSYVCAVKRKFRVPGQTFAENIGSLIGFIEAHPLMKAGEMFKTLSGVAPASDGAPAEAPAEVSPAQQEKIVRMQGDLRWLVSEGYVTEFIDGGLYASPPIAEARKKEVEAEETDEPESEDEHADVPSEALAKEEAPPSGTKEEIPPLPPGETPSPEPVAPPPASS